MKKIIFILFIIFLPLLTFSASHYLLLENDTVYDTDRHYTHGTKYIYVNSTCLNIFDNIYKDKIKHTAFTLAQHMYAPSDISKEDLILNDRPYGGWLYFGISLYAYSKDFSSMNFIEVDSGIVGPYSFSDQTQTFVHKNIGAQKPMGWDNQIKNEYGMNIIYQKKYKYKYDIGSLDYEFIPYYGGSLGNVFTYLDIGLIFRTGYNIPNNFGLPKIEPTPKKLNDSFSIYYFIDCFPRYVIRNIFLDGNTLRESHRVDKENLVTDITHGLSISFKSFSISYGYTYRTKEFNRQSHHNEFGLLIFSWDI